MHKTAEALNYFYLFISCLIFYVDGVIRPFVFVKSSHLTNTHTHRMSRNKQ